MDGKENDADGSNERIQCILEDPCDEKLEALWSLMPLRKEWQSSRENSVLEIVQGDMVSFSKYGAHRIYGNMCLL